MMSFQEPSRHGSSVLKLHRLRRNSGWGEKHTAGAKARIDLIGRHRWWSRVDTIVAIEAFRKEPYSVPEMKTRVNVARIDAIKGHKFLTNLDEYVSCHRISCPWQLI
jgi:hypothetical protein